MRVTAQHCRVVATAFEFDSLVQLIEFFAVLITQNKNHYISSIRQKYNNRRRTSAIVVDDKVFWSVRLSDDSLGGAAQNHLFVVLWPDDNDAVVVLILSNNTFLRKVVISTLVRTSLLNEIRIRRPGFKNDRRRVPTWTILIEFDISYHTLVTCYGAEQFFSANRTFMPRTLSGAVVCSFCLRWSAIHNQSMEWQFFKFFLYLRYKLHFFTDEWICIYKKWF